MTVSNFDPDGLPSQQYVPRWLADYDDIVEGDTITVDLELLDRLAVTVEHYDNHDRPSCIDAAFAVIDAARKLIADTAGDQVTP